MISSQADFEDFQKLDIRVGEIVDVKDFPEANKPAYRIWVDLGEELGIKKSSAQITKLYSPEELEGKQVICVVNFPPLQIASFESEILILGVYRSDGVVLLQPDEEVSLGSKIG